MISAIRFLIYKLRYRSKVFSGASLGMVGRKTKLCVKGKDSSLKLGRRPILSDHVELQSRGILQIGDNFCINRFSRIVSFKKIEIGHNVTIAQFVTILDHDHAYEFSNGKLVLNGYSQEPIKIGSNVWIGDKVTVLKGVTIGDNVIIGANSLVNKNVPGNCLAAGNPCRVIRRLED
ncbi:MAG: acyltransferase [Deltaproteobacteria bacterium]|nr:acyltransferase [Deltaproteobacteria bacterium]